MPYFVRDIHGMAIKQRNQSSVMVAGKANKANLRQSFSNAQDKGCCFNRYSVD